TLFVFEGTRAGFELIRCNGCATQWKRGATRETQRCPADRHAGHSQTCRATDESVGVPGPLPSLFVTTENGLTEQPGEARQRLSASREKLEKTVESRQNRAAPEQRQHFEDARTAGASGDGHARGVNQRSRFRANGRGRVAQRGLEVRFVERFHGAQR